MLEDWQGKFPKSFRKYKNLFPQLSSVDETYLSNLLISAENYGLLDEQKVGFFFHVSKDFLEQHIAINGLHQAATIYELSYFDYDQKYFSQFQILAKVLANPLCQTIFDARLRCFSDYSCPKEPITSKDADVLIHQLDALTDEERRIQTFFDFFTKFRPFPPTQKYLLNTDMADQVCRALNVYYESQIKSINTYQDCLQVRETINTLKTNGGNLDLFNQMKYFIASIIESEDLYSMRDYDQLMNDIWQAFRLPQVGLDTFAAQLQEKEGYYLITRPSSSKHTLFSSPIYSQITHEDPEFPLNRYSP